MSSLRPAGAADAPPPSTHPVDTCQAAWEVALAAAGAGVHLGSEIPDPVPAFLVANPACAPFLIRTAEGPRFGKVSANVVAAERDACWARYLAFFRANPALHTVILTPAQRMSTEGAMSAPRALSAAGETAFLAAHPECARWRDSAEGHASVLAVAQVASLEATSERAVVTTPAWRVPTWAWWVGGGVLAGLVVSRFVR